MKQHNIDNYLIKYKEQQEIKKEIKELKKKERWLILSYPALSKDQQDELEEIWKDITKLDKQYSKLQEEKNKINLFTNREKK